jgi:acyl-CoA reductase-like NAD-dependent aldehyde dehydrogenase
VGLIAPWNYPLLEAIWKIAPALAAGNTCVLKPSELTTLTTLALGRIGCEVLPAGVLNVVTGEGRPTGEAIVAHPGVSMVSMTGDVATGRTVAATAAATLKRLHLELGGKAPVVVLDDADPETVADAMAVASFVNSGQDCTAACRIIVAREIYEPVVAALVERAGALRLAEAPDDAGADLGPLVSERQRERVLGFLARATQAGARVLTGGRAPDRPGFFVEPTVVVDVEQGSEIVQNEVFGPVVTVQAARSYHEAIEFANGVRYGLASSVWTEDLRRATLATRDLEFGTVWVNDHLPTPSEMPFGGFGDSGYGKELSTHAIDEYTRVKHVMTTVAAE